MANFKLAYRWSHYFCIDVFTRLHLNLNYTDLSRMDTGCNLLNLCYGYTHGYTRDSKFVPVILSIV